MHGLRICLSSLAFLLAGSVAMSAGTTAQPATPTTSSVSVSPLVQAWMDAYTSQDPDAYAALYTSDGIYEDVPSGQAAQGHEAIAELVAGYFETQADFVFEPLAFFQGEGWAFLETNTSATDLDTGQRIAGVRIATVFELDNGLIHRSSDYYDVAGILAQLGLLPAAEEGSPAAGTPAT
jgi:steroid delta-isomerase-like uncharacterized protein